MQLHNPLPLNAGIGLKHQHFAEALQRSAQHDWFEVHAENYLMEGGPLLQGLLRVRERAQISLHCVGMSPGSADGIDENHVRRIKALCDKLQPSLVSDHLAWTRWGMHSLNDLLPLPYSEAALTLVCSNITRIQEILGRRIAIENPSVYFAFAESDMDEADFMTQMAKRTGCALLLDLNNLVVNANNVSLNTRAYLDRIPASLVTEYHLAGHKVEQHEHGLLCIDDHGSAVSAAVWALYEQALQIIGPRPTLLEWDTNVPAFAELKAEANKADQRLQQSLMQVRRHA